MATTKLVNEMLAAGFSWDDIKGDATESYKEMLAAGFTQEEVDEDIYSRYGFKFSYDPSLEDDLILLDDLASSPSPEKAEQELIDAEVKYLAEQERIAAEIEKARTDENIRKPFKDSYTPEQQAKIEEERKTLPSSRKYTDTELANQSLYDLRDSVVISSSERGALTDDDRKFQESLIKQKIIKGPPQQEEVIRASTPAEVEYARQNPMPSVREAESIGDYITYGFRHSTTGLFFAPPPKDLYLPRNPSFAGKCAMMLAQGIGDVPTTVLGGVMGAAATVETGPGAVGGAFAGAMALNEGVRSTLMMRYQRGPVDSFDELIHRTAQIGLVSGKAALTGYMAGYTGGMAGLSSSYIAPSFTGVAGNVLRASAQPAVEIATMTAAHSAMDNKLPTMEDLAMGGLMVGGMRLGGFYTNKLAYGFQKAGLTPESFIQYAKKAVDVKEDLLAGNMALPKELGGNFQPLYLIKRNTPFKEQGTSNNWYHMSQNTALKVTEGINNKNGVKVPDAPEGYTVQNAAIPAETNLLWIKSRSDPNKVRLYKQFMLDENPDVTFGEQSIVSRDAATMFENPTPAFREFLQSGKGRIGPKENVPLKGVQGMRVGDRVLIFDENAILSGSVLDTINKPMEIAAADIQKSVSVNENTELMTGQLMYDTYQAMVDRFQPLNKQAKAGRYTIPYMAARLYMGVDGLVNHWLTIGRTAFSRGTRSKSASLERPVIGKSLKEIFDMGKARVKFNLDPEVAAAIESAGVRIKEASVKSNKQMLDTLESMRKNNEITPAAYEKAKAQILESTDALTNRDDPLNLFRTYLIAKHANELAANGITTGIDPAAAKSIAKNPALIERFEAAAQELYAYQRALLDYRYKAGLISKKTYDKIVLQYPDYIPFDRVMDPGTVSTSTGTYSIKGSTRDLVDPFESIIRQTHYSIREAERNAVMRLIAQEFGQKPKGRGSATMQVGTLASFKQAEAAERGSGSMRSISYRVAGKEVKVEVPDDIWRTAQYLDPVSANAHNGLVKAAASVTGVLRAGAVLHPNFGSRNFFRDQFSAYINSDSGYKMFYDFGRGLASVVSPKTGKTLFPKAQEYYSEWLRHGGSNANLVSQDRAFTQDMIKTLLETNNVQNSVPFTLKALDGIKHYINPLNWGRKGYRALQALSEASEEGTRLGEFIRAREQGTSPAEAAFRSREVTIDFARMGANMKALNAMSVFLNAKIQGADKGIRQLRAHPLRTTNRIIGSIVLPSMLLAMVQQDIIHNSPDSTLAQTLLEVPDWQKNTFWLIPTDVGVFRVPIPQEFGVPFANPTRSFVEYMYQNDPDKNFLMKLYDEDYFGAVAEQFFLDGRTIISSMIPSAVQPFAEVAMNYSLFTGTAIIPPVMESQLPESRYNRNTTELSKTISRALSNINPLLDSNITQRLISPPAIDYLIAGYGGSIGRDLWSMMDTLAQKWGIVDKVTKPEGSLEDLPLVGAFMVKYPSAGSKSLNTFFERADRFEQTLASIKALMKDGTATSVERAEYLLMNADYGRLTNIRGAIADMSKMVRIIHLAPSPEEDPESGIPPEDKRAQIDSIYLDMITLARGGLEIIDAIERTNKEMRKEQ